jgi:hypothetical protein
LPDEILPMQIHDFGLYILFADNGKKEIKQTVIVAPEQTSILVSISF